MKRLDIGKYRRIPFKKRDKCVVCGKKTGRAVIELADFPMTEIYTDKRVKEKVALCDQNFHLCQNCGHGQLANVIDTDLQYGDSKAYSFRASKSATGRDSADFFVDFLRKTVKERRLGTVIELGCNDMYILRSLADRADKLIGIDPILRGKEKKYTQGNLVAIGDFFENISIKDKADIVICKDTLEHVENPKQFVKKIVDMGGRDTLFFFQFPMLETLLNGFRFDQIFHQHLNYFSLKSIIYMLKELGCSLLDFRINHNLWGSILIAFKKGKGGDKFIKQIKTYTPKEILARYAVFKNNMTTTRKLLEFLEKEDENVYGYGAALMLPVLSYHLENDFSSFVCIADDDPGKDGLYYINLPVEIRNADKIMDMNESVVLVTAISTVNNTRHIIAKLSQVNPKKIIVPLNIF